MSCSPGWFRRALNPLALIGPMGGGLHTWCSSPLVARAINNPFPSRHLEASRRFAAMTLTTRPDPAAPSDALSSLRLPANLRLTPEQFEQVCQANPDAVLERSADGQLIVMTPTGGDTGQCTLTLGALLWQAVRVSGAPLRIFDSSTGFRLPDGSVLSPSAPSRRSAPIWWWR